MALTFRHRPFLIALLVATNLFSWPASASGPQPGGVEGVVTDPTGARVPDVRLVVENERLRFEARTDYAGRYRLELPSGSYWLQVSAAGFFPTSRPTFELLNGGLLTFDFTLLPFGVQTVLTIEHTQDGKVVGSEKDTYARADEAQLPLGGFKLLVTFGSQEKRGKTVQFSGFLTAHGRFPVVVAFNTWTIRADQVLLDIKARRLWATGNVTIHDGRRRVEFDRAEVELEPSGLVILKVTR